MGLIDLWNKIKSTPTFRPARIRIPSENIDPPLRVASAFVRDQQYFQVTVNEMYLTYEREWFKTWEPIVYTTTQFLYDGKRQEVPFFVGQKKMEESKTEKLPKGMIFENTKVAGLHPYSGGDFSISVILGRAKRNDYLRKVITIIEDISETYLGGFGTSVLAYTNVAKVIADSFEDLLGSDDVEPLIGHKITMSPDVAEGFYPGYFVLVNEDEGNLDASKLYIKNGHLVYGDSLQTASPYRNDDYVLYSVLATNSRSDVEVLPYFESFRKLKQFVAGFQGNINDEQKKDIEARLIAVSHEVRNSPDLTRGQVEKQLDEFWEEIKQMIGRSRRLSGTEVAKKDPRGDWEIEMDKKISSLLQ